MGMVAKMRGLSIALILAVISTGTLRSAEVTQPFRVLSEDFSTTLSMLDTTGLWLNGSAIRYAAGVRSWTLPSTNGSADYVLKTDGAGALSWTAMPTPIPTPTPGPTPAPEADDLASISARSTDAAKSIYTMPSGTSFKVTDTTASPVLEIPGNVGASGFALTIVRDLEIHAGNPGVQLRDETASAIDYRISVDSDILSVLADAGSDGTFELTPLSLSSAGLLSIAGNLQLVNNKYIYAAGTSTILLGDDDTIKVAGQIWSSKGLAGTYGSLTSANAKLLLYYIGAANWAGLGADGSGRVWLRTGLSAEYPYIFDATGRLGIGKTPDKRLEILDSAAAQLRLTYTTGATVDFTSGLTGDLLIEATGGNIYTASALQLGNAASPAAYNRLGAGTSAMSLNDANDLLVSDDLEVQDAGTIGGEAKIYGLAYLYASSTVDSLDDVALVANGGANNTSLYIKANTGYSPALAFGRNDTRTWKIEDNQSNADLEFSFWTGSAWSRAMRLENTSKDLYVDGRMVFMDKGTDTTDYCAEYLKNGLRIMRFHDTSDGTDYYMYMDLTEVDTTYGFGIWRLSATEP